MPSKPKWGQHFLRDRSVPQAIAGHVVAHSPDWIVEIGPGRRALTDALLATHCAVYAVERDRSFLEGLRRPPRAIVWLQDVRTLDWTRLARLDGRGVIAGNLPYYLSAPILGAFCDAPPKVVAIVVMLQREVALRIASGPGSRDWNALGVAVGRLWNARALFDVPPEAFAPPPDVTSTVLELTPRADRLPLRSTHDFRVLVRAAFLQRRKKLSNALAALVPREDPLWQTSGEPALLPSDWPDQRAERLSSDQFVALSNVYTLAHASTTVARS